MAEGEKSKKSIIIIIAIIIVLGGAIGGYFALKGNQETEVTNKNTVTDKNTNTAASLKQYDGKLLKITSAEKKVEGKGIIAYQEEKDNLLVYFHAFINDSLALNGTCGDNVGSTGCGDMISYEYHFKLLKENKLKYGAYLSPIVCSKNKYPDDITQLPWEFYQAENCGVDPQIGETTENFLAWGSFEIDSYDGILGSYSIELIDSSSFWIANEVDDSNGGKTNEYNLDSEKALTEGSKTTSYTIEIEEK